MHRAAAFATLTTILAVTALLFGPAGLVAAHETNDSGHAHPGDGQSPAQLPDETATVVEIDRSGDVLVRTHVVFDLANEQQAADFQQFQNNSTIRQNTRAVTIQRFRQVASRAENPNASVATVQIRTTAAGDKGVVTIFVLMRDLALVEDDKVSVGTAFENFPLSREFRFHPPDGYEFTSVSPAPASEKNGVVTYNAGQRLRGFEMVAQEKSPLPVHLPEWGLHAVNTIVALLIGGGAVHLWYRGVPDPRNIEIKIKTSSDDENDTDSEDDVDDEK